MKTECEKLNSAEFYFKFCIITGICCMQYSKGSHYQWVESRCTETWRHK